MSRDKNKGLWYNFSTRQLNSMGLASGVRGTEACWRANAAPAQEQQKSWSHGKTGGRLHRWSNLYVSKHVWKNGWTYISCRCDEASESGMKLSPIERWKRWRTSKKQIDSAETTLHNQQFSAEGEGWVGVWGPLGGLGIGWKQTKTCYYFCFHRYQNFRVLHLCWYDALSRLVRFHLCPRHKCRTLHNFTGVREKDSFHQKC